MRIKKVTWKTDDDCWDCGHSGMIFVADNHGDESLNVHSGWLFCPGCRLKARSIAYDYQVPAEAQGLPL